MKALQQESAAHRAALAFHAGTATHPAQRYVIRRLRRLIPRHAEAMNWLEAQRVAAAQGALTRRLATQAGLDPVHFVSTLPVVRVVKDPHLPDFRTSYWDEHAQQWVIVVRATDPPEHRHFSILHEFKRILDRGHEAELYDPRYLHGHVQSEMAADHFASCALMPAAAVRAALRDGARPSDLARHFRVSSLRTSKRLSDLNLLPIITKHPKGGNHAPHATTARRHRGADR